MQLRVEGKVGHQHTRASNRRLILQLLFRSKSYSRADLARLTGLTPATVSSLVASLIDEGLVFEDGLTPVKVGKPSKRLKLNGSAFTSICVDLSSNSELRVAALDLNGRQVCRSSSDLSGVSGRDVLELAVGAISETIPNINGPILGIGVGTPGIVGPTGMVIEASNLGLYDFNLSKELQNLFDLPVVISNDANAGVLAEFSRAEQDIGNMMAIKIGIGVGAGIILNGSLHLGETSAVGEIGHVVVEDDGPPCRCGNRGCLETFLSISALRAAVDDEALLEIIGQRLGRALGSLVSVLGIHNIVVLETGIPIQSKMCEIALAFLRKSTLKYLGEKVDIRPSRLGKDVVLLGANISLINHEIGVA